MKRLDVNKLDQRPGRRLQADETFSFQCHAGLSCFNRCCRNLNLMLYPYDVVRLKNRLEISSDRFIGDYTDLVLRPDNYFPEVLLKMADNQEHTCPFLRSTGCSVYSDRPDACRTFPLEQGVVLGERADQVRFAFWYRPPDFCLGRHEQKVWTSQTWLQDQEADVYQTMSVEWAKVKSLFSSNPWNEQGMESPAAKMAFMAAYNVDLFREFVFESTFLKRYKVSGDVLKKIKTVDTALMRFGFEWIKFFVWGVQSKNIKLKQA